MFVPNSFLPNLLILCELNTQLTALTYKKTARLFIVELFIQITIKCNNPACQGDIRNQIFL